MWVSLVVGIWVQEQLRPCCGPVLAIPCHSLRMPNVSKRHGSLNVPDRWVVTKKVLSYGWLGSYVTYFRDFIEIEKLFFMLFQLLPEIWNIYCSFKTNILIHLIQWFENIRLIGDFCNRVQPSDCSVPITAGEGFDVWASEWVFALSGVLVIRRHACGFCGFAYHTAYARRLFVMLF